jgi:hypothetical protein
LFAISNLSFVALLSLSILIDTPALELITPLRFEKPIEPPTSNLFSGLVVQIQTLPFSLNTVVAVHATFLKFNIFDAVVALISELPRTSSFQIGLPVQIPTLPSSVILIFSLEFVVILTG